MKDLVAYRTAFTNPIEWKAAKELLKRGYKKTDHVRHFFWEWMAISPKKINQPQQQFICMKKYFDSTVKMTWCRRCGGTGEGPDSSTSEYTPICDSCHGSGEKPVKSKSNTP